MIWAFKVLHKPLLTQAVYIPSLYGQMIYRTWAYYRIEADPNLSNLHFRFNQWQTHPFGISRERGVRKRKREEEKSQKRIYRWQRGRKKIGKVWERRVEGAGGKWQSCEMQHARRTSRYYVRILTIGESRIVGINRKLRKHSRMPLYIHVYTYKAESMAWKV